MLLLSIVVPVYNVSSYLSRCLDSLLNQSIDSAAYEIIVVNDGSTDNSLNIAQRYAGNHPQIVIVSQENGGLSAARNSGVKVARGKYIQFVDSDDYLEPDVLNVLLEKMERECLDVLRFNYQNVNEHDKVFQPNRVYRQFVDYRDEVTDGLSFLTERLGFGCYAWQFLIRAEILQQNQLFFKSGIYFEDTEWTPRMLLMVKRVTSTDLVVYNYLMRQGSITQSITDAKKKKVLEDKMELVDSLLAQRKVLTDGRWHDGMIGQTVISILGTVSLQFFSVRKEYIDRLKMMSVFPISNYHCTERNRGRVKFINFSPLLYCWFIHLKNKR
ncbi:MAG: glycosyltransferase [Paludibacteraceae bacterium]